MHGILESQGCWICSDVCFWLKARTADLDRVFCLFAFALLPQSDPSNLSWMHYGRRRSYRSRAELWPNTGPKPTKIKIYILFSQLKSHTQPWLYFGE